MREKSVRASAGLTGVVNSGAGDAAVGADDSSGGTTTAIGPLCSDAHTASPAMGTRPPASAPRLRVSV